MPGRVRLAPDRLTQRERGVQRGRGTEVDRVPRDRAGVVVLDNRQPGPDGPATGGDHPQVELGVVSLPDRVGALGLAAVNQVVHLPVPLGPLVREHHQRGVERAGNGVHGAVRGHRPALVLGDLDDPPVHPRQMRCRPAQGQPFDQVAKFLGDTAVPGVRARGANETGKTSASVGGSPPLCGPAGNARLGGGPCQRDAVLKVRL